MAGEKLLPYVIGTAKQPRSFTRQKLKVERFAFWRNNQKAWMTSELFNDFLKVFEKEMRARGKQHVLLIVDNCPSHIAFPSTRLRITNLQFFPPNVTAKVMPMD